MSKTSVKITGIKGIEQATKKAIGLIDKDRELFKDLGETVVGQITGSAKAGRDLNKTKFKNVSDSWRDRRVKLAAVNNTDPLFQGKSKKSNLTFTGQLLNSFTYRVNMTALSLGFLFKGSRKPYKGLRKPELDGPSTNAELASKIEETRPFVFISQKLNQILTLKVIKALRRNLQNYKKLSRVLGSK